MRECVRKERERERERESYRDTAHTHTYTSSLEDGRYTTTRIHSTLYTHYSNRFENDDDHKTKENFFGGRRPSVGSHHKSVSQSVRQSKVSVPGGAKT